MTNVQPLNPLIRAECAVLPDGERAVDVGVRDGRVVAVDPPGSPLGDRAGAVVELDRDEVLLPGLVDSHVHVKDPGRTKWEGFETATKAAPRRRPSGWVACRRAVCWPARSWLQPLGFSVGQVVESVVDQRPQPVQQPAFFTVQQHRDSRESAASKSVTRGGQTRGRQS